MICVKNYMFMLSKFSQLENLANYAKILMMLYTKNQFFDKQTLANPESIQLFIFKSTGVCEKIYSYFTLKEYFSKNFQMDFFNSIKTFTTSKVIYFQLLSHLIETF